MKLKILFFPALLAIIIITSSCASYKYSNFRKGEDLKMEILNQTDIIDIRSIQSQEIPGPRSRGIGIGEVVSLAAEGIKLLMSADKKKYVAEYTYGLSENYFYDRISDVSAFDISGMQFEGFKLLREVQLEDGTTDTALYISLKVVTENPYEIFNNSAFRLMVDDFVMKYSKAKIPASKWYMPWTWFFKKRTNINIDFNITFTATWSGINSGIHRDEEIGNFYLNLRNIPLGNPEKFEQYREEIIGMPLYGSSFIVPRSYGTYLNDDKDFAPAYGQGIFDILVEVTEAGKEHFVTKVVQDNSDKIIEEVRIEILNQL